ncbi:serine hydrolase [Streptomyces sp. V2I9]|uniref:serine hydrolase domain-containing protein n=1 Tax=Streptomyces sp. V2I9 TaxID=3042304 RepID=UPI002784CA2C|nr:serine hydrolase domain-containing protein [Streptomyces sp. V2I9]MDQ0986768.1 D-alanyl-D-alanine carboxypeptidase [Streptomyces sp. V2I9]
MPVSTSSSPSTRTAFRAAALTVLAALGAGLVTAPAAAAAPPARTSDPVQRQLDALVRDGVAPGALAQVVRADGEARHYTSGVGNPATGSAVPRDGSVRIGSNTKAFTATVVLHLVGEGAVALDEPVDTYLPGLLRGDGIDGRAITVRQILQHTSGLPEYLDRQAVLTDPHRYYEPRELLDRALDRPADFAPGARWAYSNTNYVVAGLLVQKVTGRPLGEEITRRITDRVGLRHTYLPAPGDMTVRGRHPHGYHRLTADGPWRDYTELAPSWGWAAGGMVSTDSDLNRFYRALFSGRLLAPAQLAEMRRTVPVDAEGALPGTRYGLGVQSTPLSCGGRYWGHGGSIPGFSTYGGVTADGRAVNVTVTAVPDGRGGARAAAAVDTAMCR